MNKVGKTANCARCGEEMSGEEMTLLTGTTCALCNHMQLEALDVRHGQTESAVSPPLLHATSVSAR